VLHPAILLKTQTYCRLIVALVEGWIPKIILQDHFTLLEMVFCHALIQEQQEVPV